MPTNPNDIKKLEAINAALSAALPTLGLALELGRMAYDLFKTGPGDADFDASIAKMNALATKMKTSSAQWFEENPDFDPATGKRRV